MNREAFSKRLGYTFANPALLAEALTHRSFGTPNYERLEFLGDSVLNCVIARAIYERFPQLPEGRLSRVRAMLVRQEALHRIATALDLGAVLRLGEGELKSGGHNRPSILADSLEALFGAVLLDGGFDEASRVILSLYAGEIETLDPEQSQKDAKTELQEWLQARRSPLPVYTMIEVEGAAHAQHFVVECVVNAFGVSTRGEGASRRVAEQVAAARALEKLQA